MAKKCKKLEEIKAMFNDFEVDLDSINTKVISLGFNSPLLAT